MGDGRVVRTADGAGRRNGCPRAAQCNETYPLTIAFARRNINRCFHADECRPGSGQSLAAPVPEGSTADTARHPAGTRLSDVLHTPWPGDRDELPTGRPSPVRTPPAAASPRPARRAASRGRTAVPPP